jgi:NAD(P)-dependent dehydrogenase (short-subunit alcohol dehydrogenase family)
MAFVSFPAPFSALVVGARGGIGAALVEALLADTDVSDVLALSRNTQAASAAKLHQISMDFADEASIAAAAQAAKPLAPRLIIVATGMLHTPDKSLPEKSLRHINAAGLAQSFAVNTIGPALVAKHFLPLLPRTGKSVFAVLSARVGSISDNRLGGWYGYRASKAALNMLIRTAAIEIAPKWPEAVCLSVHPGTVDTALSKPFQGAVPDNKLFTAAHAAHAILQTLDRVAPSDSGGFVAFDGAPIPF